LIVFVLKLDMTPVLAPINPVVMVDAIKKIVLIVLARMELVKKATVDKELGRLVSVPLPVPGRAPLMEDTQSDNALI
jgi:hypothetical protein